MAAADGFAGAGGVLLGDGDGDAGPDDPDDGVDADGAWLVVVVTVVQAASPAAATSASVATMIFMAHLPLNRPVLPDYEFSVTAAIRYVVTGVAGPRGYQWARCTTSLNGRRRGLRTGVSGRSAG